MSLSNNLKYLRKLKGYSQDYIAEKLGYKSFTTIQKWESGISEPSVKVLKKLSAIYNVSMDELLNSELGRSASAVRKINSFGEKLKKIRQSRDMSQETLANLLNTSKQVISKYETNQRVPQLTIVEEYATKLNIPLNYFLSETENASNANLSNPGDITPLVSSTEINIGDRIRDRRIELSLSVEDLAEKIGKSQATIYQYENGDINKFPLETLEPIAEALRITPAELMGWKNHSLQKNSVSNTLEDMFKAYPERAALAISSLIKHLRIEKDRTEKSIALSSDISLQDYLDFESGKTKLDLTLIKRILRTLNLTEEYICIMMEGFIVSNSEDYGYDASSLKTIIDTFQVPEEVRKIQKMMVGLSSEEKESILKAIIESLESRLK